MTIMRINRPLGPILVLILALLGSSLVLAEEPDPALRIVPEDARASEWGIAISPDGRFLASGGDNGLVSVWDLARLRPLWQCQRRAIKIRALEFSLDGSRLYGFTEDGQFWVWEGLTGAVISTSPDVRAGVYTASFSPDRSWAIVDAYGYDGKAWDTVKGESTLQWSNRKGIIRALAIAPDGDRFLSADTENRFKLWEKGWQSATASRKGPPDGEPYCLAWARDGEAFWSGHEDGQVWLWDARAFLVKNRIANLGESVITLAVSPAGNLAAAGSHGGMIVAWKTAEPDKPVYTLQAAGAGIRNLVFAPDSSLLAAGCYDGVVRLYNAKSATLIASLYADKGGDWLALSPEGWFHGSDWGIYAYLRVALGEGVREIGDGEMPRLDSRSLAQSFLRARLEGSARPGR